MELDVEELDHLKRKLNITIPGEVVSKKVNAAYRELNRQLKMPGFRPGKIPQKILEKQIPVQSLTQVFQDLLQDYYEQALRETGITPAGTPEIDHSKLQDVKKDEPLSFSVTLECRPSIEVKGYKGLKFKKTEANITDEEVEEGIQNILGRYGHFDHCEVEHAVQKEDYVTLDFDGTLRGEPLENGSAKDLQVRIGENKLIRGFEDQLIGHKLG